MELNFDIVNFVLLGFGVLLCIVWSGILGGIVGLWFGIFSD